MALSRRGFGLEATTAVALFLLGGGILLFVANWVTVPGARRPGSTLKLNAPRQAAPALSIVTVEGLPVDGALRERLVLSDPQPLFLPAGNSVALTEPEPAGALSGGRAAGAFPPALYFADSAPARDVLRPLAPASPAEAASWLAATRWFSGLARQGEAEASPPGAVNRVATVEVYRANESGRIVAMDITRLEGLDARVWKPLMLTVLIESAGAVTQPAVAVSSGVDEVDERIRWIVGRELLPTLSLRPGMYRLQVGP